jgi:2-C-methyl-D-erythritol 4-phosphate cytidylyltransferase
MSKSPAYWFVVPAAGSGRRMGSEKPKQYLQIQHKTILDYTLSRLLAVKQFAGIVLALDADDKEFFQSQYAQHEKIVCVVGGKERADSVLAGLIYLQDKIIDNDWVLVHDAARPCIRPDEIEQLQMQLKDDPVGGILAVPVADTLKCVEFNSILQTVDRSALWQAQTPQMFRYGVLYQSLTRALQNQQTITDEASAVELTGLTAKIVQGRSDNIKITRPADLDLAEFILQKQELS